MNTAIARLADFRASWNEGDEICKSSMLKAEGLDVVLEAALKRGGD